MNYDLDPVRVAEKLVILRKNKGVSQTQVAETIGITNAAVSLYESGKRIPTDEVKIKFANYYGVSVQKLFYMP